MAECRLVLVLCCEGLSVRPAHGHNPTPVCSCGWIGEEHRSKLAAELEWLEDHRYPEEGIEARLAKLPRTSIDVTGYWGYGPEE